MYRWPLQKKIHKLLFFIPKKFKIPFTRPKKHFTRAQTIFFDCVILSAVICGSCHAENYAAGHATNV